MDVKKGVPAIRCNLTPCSDGAGGWGKGRGRESMRRGRQTCSSNYYAPPVFIASYECYEAITLLGGVLLGLSVRLDLTERLDHMLGTFCQRSKWLD